MPSPFRLTDKRRSVETTGQHDMTKKQMAHKRKKRYQKRKQIQKELNDKNTAHTQKAQNVSKQQDQETIRKLREELHLVRMQLHDIKDKE